MVALAPVNSYSSEELNSARLISPALDRYLILLDKKTSDPLSAWRQVRLKNWCEAVLATIYNRAPCEDICKHWTQQTELLLQKIWIHFELEKENCVLLAMGKLGARELNLSSDIDLIFVSDQDPTHSLLKKIRQWVKAVSLITEFSFCYRVDMDLRPGGSSSPLVISWDHFTNHYGSSGETWERTAMVRLRPILGPQELKDKISIFCAKFAFRKHIDLRLFNDLYLMRERIQNNILNKTLNLKYWPGGIRDLELFVHSLQLIHGGKKPSLRTTSTTQALKEIISQNLMSHEDGHFLLNTYWFYRTLENKIHGYDDQHTYELTALTNLIDEQQVQEFRQKSSQVQKIMDGFLAPHKPKNSLISDTDLQSIAESLAHDHNMSPDSIMSFLAPEARSKTYDRDENERRHFLKSSLQILKNKSSDVGLALSHLKTFMTQIRAKTSLFSLFNNHPELTEEILWIFSTSPYLSHILIHRPDLVDSFLLKSADIDTSDEGAFFKSIYDFKLVSELISASTFLRTQNLTALTTNLSHTADTIGQATLDFLLRKFPQIKVDILTLGKWAAGEMGLKSDLDFIFITNTEPSSEHFKLARRFVHSLQTPPSHPPIYSIDLRLRPSGSSGPLLSQLSDVQRYLNNSAQIWERQAYLRARLLSNNSLLQLFDHRPLSALEKIELRKIQNQLLLTETETIDLKKQRGGLLQTEFTIQQRLLNQQAYPAQGTLKSLLDTAVSDPSVAGQLLKNYEQLRTYQQLLILITDSSEVILSKKSSTFHKLANLAHQEPSALFDQLLFIMQKQDSLLKDLDPLN